jgi:sugar-phosphatase
VAADAIASASREGVRSACANSTDLEADAVYRTALITRPVERFAAVAPTLDPASCLAVLHEIEDHDAQTGSYTAFAGAAELLTKMDPSAWAVVTSNYAHRVRIRFARTGLPLPEVIIDAAAVTRGKPHPEGYLKAALALGRHPRGVTAVSCSQEELGLALGE